MEEVANPAITAETVEFLDQNPAWHMAVDSERDSTFDVGDGPNADLGDFFGRAVEIASFDWGTGLTFFESFDPWTLFFENPRVANRLANYFSLRCDLKLKFLVNGNGFYYGRQLVSYLPLTLQDQLTQARGLVSQDLIQASQRPHIFLDPTTSMGGEMTLPYFFYKNGVSIPDAEYSELGRIDMFSMTPLKHANGASGTVRITVLAWAENLTVSMPTEATTTLTPQCGEELLDPQSGEVKKNSTKTNKPKPSKTIPKTSPKGPTQNSDEYGSGPISYPASIVAKAAGALASAPVIGPYARATQIAAGAMGNVAKIFGYSRPASVEQIRPYVPQYAGNIASTNMIDSSVKLSTDAKQEVTIDPTTFGLTSSDEMTIKSIAGRESFITQTTWNVADTPGTVLFNSRVTPFMWDEYVNGSNTEHHLTAACFAAAPFKNWHGTMEFRFQIVSSAFHKGRLALHWDPYKVDPSELNVSYSRIIDIGEEKDFVMRVKWGQLYPYCVNRLVGTQDLSFRNRATLPATTANAPSQNGFVCLRVLNDLTVPNSSIDNDISINVFVRMCDDFEVVNPTDINIQSFTFFPTPGTLKDVDEEEESEEKTDPKEDSPTLLNPQSGEEELNVADQDCTEEPSKPTAPTPAFEVGGTSGEGGLADICFGEVIPSFRSILKRYNFHTNWARNGPRTTGTMWRQSPNFPYMRGFAPGAVDSSNDGPYNYCKMTMLNYVSSAFTAYRGALRWKHMLVQFGPSTDASYHYVHRGLMRAERYGFDRGAYQIGWDPWFGDGNNNDVPYEELQHWNTLHDGAHLTVQEQNPVLEVEYPHQSQLRFYPCKRANITDINTYVDYHKVSALIRHSGGEKGGGSQIFDFCAAGEDFSLHFFTGCPIIYYAPSDTSP